MNEMNEMVEVLGIKLLTLILIPLLMGMTYADRQAEQRNNIVNINPNIVNLSCLQAWSKFDAKPRISKIPLVFNNPGMDNHEVALRYEEKLMARDGVDEGKQEDWFSIYSFENEIILYFCVECGRYVGHTSPVPDVLNLMCRSKLVIGDKFGWYLQETLCVRCIPGAFKKNTARLPGFREMKINERKKDAWIDRLFKVNP